MCQLVEFLQVLQVVGARACLSSWAGGLHPLQEPPGSLRVGMCLQGGTLGTLAETPGGTFPTWIASLIGAFSLSFIFYVFKSVCFGSAAGTEPSKYNSRKMSRPLKHGQLVEKFSPVRLDILSHLFGEEQKLTDVASL